MVKIIPEKDINIPKIKHKTALQIEIGNKLLERNEYQNAEMNFKHALADAKENKNDIGMCEALIGLGKVYQARNQPNKAKMMFSEAKSIAPDYLNSKFK